MPGTPKKLDCRESMQLPTTARATAFVSSRLRFPGRERILRSLFPPRAYRDAGPQVDRVIRYDGDLLFCCDLASYIEWSIFFKGYYVPDLAMVIRRLTRPGMIAIDVGANVGAYTLLIAKRVRPNGVVVAVEPNEEVRSRLETNLRLNEGNLAATSVLECALSNRNGIHDLHLPSSGDPNRGTASLIENQLLHTDRQQVTTQRLDDLFPCLSLPSCDFLKVDTDGNDHLVLDGAWTTIERFRPVIIFEHDPDLSCRNPVGDPRDAFEALVHLRYRLHTVCFNGRLKEIWGVVPAGNVVALPD